MMKKSVWILLVIAVMLLSACGSATQPATNPETQSGEVFMVALPRIIIDFDSAGNPSVLGIKLADFGPGMAGLKLDKSYVDLMTTGNVQHLELRMVGDGITLFANGKPLPRLGWSDESLLGATDLATALNMQNAQTIKKLIPIVRRLGLDLALRFPRQPNVAEIPLVSPEEVAQLAAAPTSEPAWAIVKAEIKFDQNGVPGILGITATDLAALGVSLPAALTPANIQLLQAGNIQYMELRTQPDGLYIYANGKLLPNIVWDNNFTTNAGELYAQLAPGSPYAEIVQMAAPVLPNADIDILVHFPLAAGAEPLPIQRH